MQDQKPLTPDEKTKTDEKRPKHNKKPLIILIALIIATLLGFVFSGLTWVQSNDLKKQNDELKSKLDSQKSQIDDLTKEDSSTQPAEGSAPESESDGPTMGKIGETIETDSGSLAVNSYQRTSLHDIHPGNLSTDPILEVNITLKNSTSTAQSYDWRQFTAVNSASEIVANKSGENGYGLKTVAFEPGGSTETKIYFYNYDSKQTTLRWNNSAGQEVRVILPAL